MVIAQQLLKIPGLSSLTFNDEQLFRKAFSAQQPQYAHSWLYLLRAAHVNNGKLGYKYVSPSLVATIGYRHEYIYITPLFDLSGGASLQTLCEKVFQLTGYPVLVKKALHHAFPLASALQKVTASTDFLEDDAYPEAVIHLQSLFVSPAGAINHQAKKLARRARAFEQKHLEFQCIEDIGDVHLKKIEHFLAKDPEKYANYWPIVQYLHQQKSNRYTYRTMIFMHKGQIRGLYMTEVLSFTEVGLYGGITSKDAGGITEWMDIYFFRKLFLEGIQRIHLGGAERKGIADYIGKLLPQRPSYLTQTLLYDTAALAPRLQFQPTIRLAQEIDISSLSALYRTVYNALEELGEIWTLDSAHKFISHFYHRQPDLFFLAEHDDHILGGVVAAIQPWWDGNHLVEGEIFVDPKYRHTNLDKQLLKALLTEARHKYQAIAWDTLTPTTDGHPLGNYEKIGFSEVPQWAAITGDIPTVLQRLA